MNATYTMRPISHIMMSHFGRIWSNIDVESLRAMANLMHALLANRMLQMMRMLSNWMMLHHCCRHRCCTWTGSPEYQNYVECKTFFVFMFYAKLYAICKLMKWIRNLMKYKQNLISSAFINGPLRFHIFVDLLCALHMILELGFCTINMVSNVGKKIQEVCKRY